MAGALNPHHKSDKMKNTIIVSLETRISNTLKPCADWAAFLRSESRNTFLADASGALLALDFDLGEGESLDLSGLDLSALCWLNLSENGNLKKLQLPASMPGLLHLDASQCALDALKLPVDAFSKPFSGAPPRDVPSLYLQKNKLRSVQFLGRYPGLEMLDLSHNALVEFSLPVGFERLAYLYLNDNTNLKNLRFDAPLRQLEILHLRNCKLEHLPHQLLSFDGINTLYLHGNPLKGLPTGVVPKEERENAWDAVRAYLEELGQGVVVNERVKIILVGNGRVGKTSLLRRLRDEPFNLKEPYTHGIGLDKHLNKGNLPEVSTPGLQAQVWDFGGQEIFYATHQFFLSEDALYVFAWTNEENVRSHRERDAANLPIDKFQTNEYWLENIRHRGGPKCPILMVQTHCEAIETPCNADDLRKEYGAICLNFDASNAYGLPQLKKWITQKLNKEIPFFGGKVPRSYDRCITEVENIRSEYPSISKNEFEAKVCQIAGVLSGNETEALQYLHRTGAVVWFSNVEQLKDRVFTDPNWLTKQVYRLINKELESTGGRFGMAYLKKHLPTFKEEERKQFIELLKTFGLLFETREDNELVFIAPNYLPEALTYEAQKLLKTHEQALRPVFQFAFPKFMPDNVMVNFLSRYGPYSNELYWKNGIFFTDANGQRALVKLAGRCLEVFAEQGEQSLSLQAQICQAFVELSGNANAELTVKGRTVSWQALEKAREQGVEDMTDREGDFVKVAHFAQINCNSMKEHNELASVKQPIYLSYAWGDTGEQGESREKIVKELISTLEADSRFALKYDKKEVGYRKSIREFESELVQAKQIVVVLSDRYLKSSHCMFELLQIFRKSGSEAAEFREKIVPIVLPDAKIHDTKSIIAYIKHWKEDVEDLKKDIDDIGWDLAASVIPDFTERKEIMSHIGELAKIIGDVNTLKPQELSADNFDKIVQSLLNPFPEQ